MGEHDLRNEDDGPHQDIPIARSVSHEHYNSATFLNDIAMIHLERDVEFSGELSKSFRLHELTIGTCKDF